MFQTNKDTISVFGSEWFGMSIATLALAEVYILAYQQDGFVPFFYLGNGLMALGIILFFVILVLWSTRGILIHDKIHGHWDNLTRLSFISLIPIIGFISNSQLIYFYGLSSLSASFSLMNYLVEYSLALILGVILGYRLYTKEINLREINYAVVIPPLAIGTGVFLGSDLIGFYGGGTGSVIYYLTIIGLGIFFFLYIFIGSLALSGHVTNKVHETLPTTMLPVGIASLIVINILSIVSFNKLHIFQLSLSTAGFVSLMLWGFEIWNFLVVTIIIFTRPPRGSMSSWAYGFPLGLFAISTVRMISITNEHGLIWVFTAIAVALNTVWIYAWLNTIIFMMDRKRKLREIDENTKTSS